MRPLELGVFVFLTSQFFILKAAALCFIPDCSFQTADISVLPYLQFICNNAFASGFSTVLDLLSNIFLMAIKHFHMFNVNLIMFSNYFKCLKRLPLLPSPWLLHSA